MHVSVGELARLAPDALRGLGLSQSLGDRAAAAVVWGEAVHGLSLRFLAERGLEIEQAAKAGFELSERTAGALTVHELDARGKSLIEAGPRALDLAQAHAASDSAGLTIVRNTSGTFLAGDLVSRAVARGQPLMVVSSAGSKLGPFENNGVLIGLPAGQGETPYAAALPAAAKATQLLLSQHGLPDAAARRAAELLLSFMADAEDGSPGLAVLAWHLAGQHDAAAAVSANPQSCQPTGFDARMAAALRNGMDVDEQAWKALGSYIQRIRIPTSERSRTQAG